MTLSSAWSIARKTYKPVKFAARGSAWHGVYFFAPVWWFNPGGKVQKRWLGPTQIFRITFDPRPPGGEHRAVILVSGFNTKTLTIPLPRSKHWWKLDGRVIMQARKRRHEARLAAKRPLTLSSI